jgi:hypothetical protein
MRQRLWRMLARMMRGIRGSGEGWSGAPKRDAEASPEVTSRARFWADFREGRREAELRAKGS